MSEIHFTRLQFLSEENNLALKCGHAAMPASKCEYSAARQSDHSGANGDLIGGRSPARALGH